MMNKERMKKLEKAEEQIMELRQSLDDLGLLLRQPDKIPKYVNRTDTEDTIFTYTHNILGWILGIVLKEKGKVWEMMGRMQK